MGTEPEGLRFTRWAPRVAGRGRSGVVEPGSDIFRAAIEMSPMPMVLSDPAEADNPIVFANGAFCRLTGYEPGEIVGRNCRFLQGADTDPEALDAVRRAIRGRHEIATELLNFRKDGSSFWNALFVSPVFDGSGALVYFFASQLDVSRRRDAEDALRGVRTSNAVAEQATGIGHDFNNLLQVIAGTADALKRRAAGAEDPRLLRGLDAITGAADRAAALTRRLLALSRGGEPVPAPERASAISTPAVDRTSDAAAAGDGTGGERILVVDDRHEVAELARTMLEGAGYAVEIAGDGAEALAKLESRFDLLFSDLVMPGGIDGVSLARQARLRQPALKVLLTTGHAETVPPEADGAEFETIAKPYRRRDLARKVRLVLDRAD